MEKIFDIAKDSEKSWGVIAQGIDGNFEELDREINGPDAFQIELTYTKAERLELPRMIPKGSRVKSNIEITCRTNRSDVEYMRIYANTETIADRDINFADSRTSADCIIEVVIGDEGLKQVIEENTQDISLVKKEILAIESSKADKDDIIALTGILKVDYEQGSYKLTKFAEFNLKGGISYRYALNQYIATPTGYVLAGGIYLEGIRVLALNMSAGQTFVEGVYTPQDDCVVEFKTESRSGYLEQYSGGGITTDMLQDKCITKEKLADNIEIKSGLESGVDIYMPSELKAVVDDTLQIFWHSIINAVNPYIFDVVALCPKGKSYKRYWVYKPSNEDINKEFDLIIRVRLNNYSTLIEKKTKIKVVAKATSPTSEKSILCIGASATTGGQWAGELIRRLTDTSGDGTPYNPTGLGISNVKLVGRKKGIVNPVPLEATGGWKVQSYGSKGETAFRLYVTGISQLNIGDTYKHINGGVFVIQEINVDASNGAGNIRCTFNSSIPDIPDNGILTIISGNGDSTISYSSYEKESFSPFWNDAEQRIDFKSYADTFCNGSLDFLIWHCGVNDIIGRSESALTDTINAFKDILRAYHSDFPNGKVIISSPPIGCLSGGMAANYGCSELMMEFPAAIQFRKYSRLLSELCLNDEFREFVCYAPSLEQFDSENGYPTSPIAVNNRCSEVELIGTNGVHPTDHGSYMVADTIYRTISDML